MNLTKAEKRITLEAMSYYCDVATNRNGEDTGLLGRERKIMKSAIEKIKLM